MKISEAFSPLTTNHYPLTTTPQVCMRCGACAVTLPYGAGLWLCEACEVERYCGEFQHVYRARDGGGVWVCLRCASTLTSVPITTQTVAAPTPQTE